MSSHKFSNELINETSPYLLQHAHNPVNWYPWSDKALQQAKDENKPILVSIGYSACHWCHVMERESFENEETAELMNKNFINIKIDREERPDLDHIYMDAVQAMTGSGGWPLNVFLTPDGKPFYGGTYFPPQKAFNRASWTDILTGVMQAFNEKRNEIDAQAENLTQHLLDSNAFGLQQVPGAEIFTNEKIKETRNNIMKAADKEWGGFGKAPKFPQTFSIQFLLRYAWTESLKGNDDKEGKDQALLSLDKMIEGGIYDQIGGGFARYSTDTEWLAPHFEKMLYDNALLLSVISEAYQLTGKERYREVIDETMGFISREMLHPLKGFYAALDADSEGVEGKYYVWDHNEVNNILGENAKTFNEFYDIKPGGNWSEGAGGEHVSILRVTKTVQQFSEEKNISEKELIEIVETGKQKLFEKRNERIRPMLDDKIILGWNALMNTAISKCFAATGTEEYRQLAISNMEFLLEKFFAGNEGEFFHTWKNEQAKYPAFLDDYAFLIEALINLQEITGDTGWLDKAGMITGFVIDQFSEEETGFFFFTKKSQTDVIIRKKEVYDGAVPSGNSVMAYNLHRLSVLLDKKDLSARAEGMLASLGNAITKYPTSFGNWASLLLEKVEGTNEIAVTGPGFEKLRDEILKEYLPHRVLMSAATSVKTYPILKEKETVEKAAIWICRNYTCLRPVFSVSEVSSLINSAPRP